MFPLRAHVPFLALCALQFACSRVDTTVQVLNGPTGDTTPAAAARVPWSTPVAAIDGPSTWALSPSTMTMALTGLAFLGVGEDPEHVRPIDVQGCTATYDRSLGSLAPLGTCGAAVPTGTYEGVVIRFATTFEMVMDDDVAGIWSDPDDPDLLVTTRPDAGPRPVSVTDQNTDADGGQIHVLFDAPITIDEGGAPEVTVVFDPTHWMKARYEGDRFISILAMGNPPIMPSIDGFAKATYYSSFGTSASYPWDRCPVGSCVSLLFLYSETSTPSSVTWQDDDICPPITGGRAPVVAFAGDGRRWGLYGRLGLDDAGTLAWASAEQPPDGASDIIGYTGVYKMPEAALPGDDVSLEYLCTGDVPPPTSGDTYASGAPTFTPEGVIPMTLLY